MNLKDRVRAVFYSDLVQTIGAILYGLVVFVLAIAGIALLVMGGSHAAVGALVLVAAYGLVHAALVY